LKKPTRKLKSESVSVAKQATYTRFWFLIPEVRQNGFLALAKVQVPVKANFMGKGFYDQL
jgi:hypothetical protein